MDRRFERDDRKQPQRAPRDQRLWAYRAFRGLRPDRNPLRRGTDRLEASLLAGIFVAAAAGAPFAAHAAAQASYANSVRTQHEQQASTHRVRAVLAQPAGTQSDYPLGVYVPAAANWTSVSGVHQSGDVPAQAGSPRGTVVTVWTDTSGHLVNPPLSASQVAGQADAAMIGALAGIAVVSVASAGAIRLVLNRRRMASWDADWLATAPTWNRQSW